MSKGGRLGLILFVVKTRMHLELHLQKKHIPGGTEVALLRNFQSRSITAHIIVDRQEILMPDRSNSRSEFPADSADSKLLSDSLRFEEIGRLAEGVAHDHRNLYTVIGGFLNNMLEREEMSDSLRRKLEMVLNATEGTIALTSGMLTFAPSLKDEWAVCVNETIRAIIPLVQHRMKQDDINLELHLDSSLPKVAISSTEVARVALNLIINAEHAMLDRREKKLAIRTGGNDSQVYFAVTDTGGGIPESERRKIFHAYYSTKGKHARAGSSLYAIRSTGMGLSIAKQLVENRGGAIEVESQVGVGSTFKVLLPCHAGEISNELLREVSAIPQVMIVEDDPDMRRIIEKTVRTSGYSPLLCSDGKEALETLRSGNRCQLIITDIMMPRMNGVDFVKIVRGDLELGSIPILITSAVSEEKDIQDLMLLGAIEFLKKPIGIQNLKGVMEILLTVHP